MGDKAFDGTGKDVAAQAFTWAIDALNGGLTPLAPRLALIRRPSSVSVCSCANAGTRSTASTSAKPSCVYCSKRCANAAAHALLELIARTGMRRGEAMALRWQDVDLEAGTLRIRGTMARVGGELLVAEPKTAKSRRTLPLSPALIARLKWQQRTQARERKRAANT